MPDETIPMWMAVHEAGHAVVADSLGIPPYAVTTDSESSAVHLKFPSQPTELESFISAAISHAGGLAQMRYGVAPSEGSHADLRSASEHIARYLGDQAPPVIHRLATLQASNLARALLEQRWDVVIELAKMIVDNGGVLDHSQLGEVLMPVGEYMEYEPSTDCSC